MSEAARPRIGILECGEPPEALRAAHGSYACMIARLLGPQFETRVFEVTAGALHAGNAAACEAYVLTGSPAGVYEPPRVRRRLFGLSHAANAG